MTREEQKTILAELEEMLPKNFDTEMIIPEIKTELHIDENDWSKGVIEIKGDVSHFQRADNPIVEIFRSCSCQYNQNLSRKDKFIFIALFPHFDAATGITTCEFYPNNCSQAIKDIGERETKKRVEQVLLYEIGATFQETLRAYFKSPSGFRKYQKFLTFLAYARNTDEYAMLVDKATHSIKKFIEKRGLPQPKKRANGA